MSLMEAWLLNSANLNGPVPIGLVRMSRSETWQGKTGDSPEASIGSSEGCGLVKWKLTSWSPLRLTSFRFSYQILRGLRRRYSGSMPFRRCQVHCTSRLVNGLPSCQATPERNLRVSVVPELSHAQLSASSGTMLSKLLCALVGSKRTRLLNTAMNGMLVAMVDSSCKEALGGCEVL